MTNQELYSPDGHHVTKLQSLCNVTLEPIYEYVEFGQVYWVDFGEGYGCEIPYQRPAVVIQDNFFNNQTVLVVPLSSKPTALYNQIINPIINFKDSDFIVGNISEEDTFALKNSSTLLFEHIKAVDLSRLRKYLFTIQRTKLKQLLKNAMSCICGLTFDDQVVKKPPLVIQNTAKIIRAAEKNAQEENSIEMIQPQPRKIEPLPFNSKHFSDKQKKIYSYISKEAYSELKYSSKSNAERIRDFVQTCFNFTCSENALNLIIDCIQITSNTKGFSFDLCEYARKNQSIADMTYEEIINQISNPIKSKFITIKGIKVSEFISFISMIVKNASI